MDGVTVDALFHFLSDPGRRGLAKLLAEAPLSVGEIAEILQLPQSTVSRHLKSLRTTGLLAERRQGNMLIVELIRPSRLDSQGIDSLLGEWLRTQELPEIVRSRLSAVLARSRNGPDAFERLAYRWDQLRQQYFGTHFHLEALWSLLPSTWHVVDIGTGTGYLLPWLSRQFQTVTAVDPSPAMLELATSRAARCGLKNIELRLGRLENLPLESLSVDLAVAILVMHHTSDLSRAFSELYRVLRKDGKVLVVELFPHDMAEFRIEMDDPVGGVSPGELVNVARDAGLEDGGWRRLTLGGLGEPGGPEKPAPEMYVLNLRKILQQ